ncbi:diguanylate cyclase [Acidovorax facilis]|jgi:diguanylate cyclase (GGDEF)-like protein|uniref:GGDEF domain-containing protein n=1 Tax=Acidovorax facilis TaxID=12917 RepID=UPI003D64FE8A
MQLDLPTILLLYKTALVAGALSIFHVSRHSCRPQGLKPLAAAYLLLAVGAELAGQGEYSMLPLWFWTHTSLLLGALGYTLFWAGARALSGRRRVLPAVLILVSGGWLVLGLVTQFPLDNLLRAGAFHLTAAVSLTAAAWEVWHDRRTESLPSRPLLAGLLLASAGTFALQLLYIATHTASPQGFALAFSVQMFCHFGVALMVSSLSNERAEVRLEKVAQTDTLTGVGNRRWAMSMLPARLPVGSAIAQLDLDHFKHINDRFGHAAGDRVLVATADALRHQLRDSDLLARMGGEEFLVYLPDASASAASAIAQRLCGAVQHIRLSELGEDIPVTVSIGLACVTSAGGTWADWLAAADRALYDAKRAGRNRVVTTHERAT